MKQIKRTDVSYAETPEPHYIPGYTGYSPQFLYRCGDTYGHLTHFLLIDPSVSHAEKLVVSNRSCSDYTVERPTLTELDLVKKREDRIDPVYKHPMLPGYKGFVPKTRGKCGNKYSVTATEGISEFERNYLKKRCEERKLRIRNALQEPETSGRSIGERSLQTTDYEFPLEEVRPEVAGIIRTIPQKDLPVPPTVENNSPINVDRFAHKKNLTCKLQNKSWFDDYNVRKSREWSPILNNHLSIKYPSNDGTSQIYSNNRPLLPGYKGHVPGSHEQYGKTFGRLSLGAKKFLQCECN